MTVSSRWDFEAQLCALVHASASFRAAVLLPLTLVLAGQGCAQDAGPGLAGPSAPHLSRWSDGSGARAPVGSSDAAVSPAAEAMPESSIRFTMHKWADPKGKEAVPVSGRFASFRVQVDSPLRQRKTLAALAEVTATVTVDLASVDTQLAQRDDNIEQAYFEVSAFPKAVFTLDNVRPVHGHDSGTVRVDAALDLHGHTQRFPDLHLDVQRVAEGWIVRTLEPLKIRSSDHGLPVQALLAMCGHRGVDDFAEVEVTLGLGD